MCCRKNRAPRANGCRNYNGCGNNNGWGSGCRKNRGCGASRGCRGSRCGGSSCSGACETYPPQSAYPPPVMASNQAAPPQGLYPPQAAPYGSAIYRQPEPEPVMANARDAAIQEQNLSPPPYSAATSDMQLVDEKKHQDGNIITVNGEKYQRVPEYRPEPRLVSLFKTFTGRSSK